MPKTALVVPCNRHYPTLEKIEPGPKVMVLREYRVTEPSARLRHLQYAVVAQLSVIGIINYMDRVTLSIANPPVRHDMGLSVSEMGLLLSAFPLTYALAQLPLGLIIDRLGSRLLLGSGLAVWSFAQCLGGFAGNASQLWASRLLLGMGEAPTLPSSTRQSGAGMHRMSAERR